MRSSIIASPWTSLRYEDGSPTTPGSYLKSVSGSYTARARDEVMNAFLRVFGAGPLGVLLTIASIGLALWARSRLPSGALGLPASIRYAVLACAGLATAAGLVWSLRSLLAAQRGRGFCMEGAYRWVRHPLYASFITLGAPGLALFFDHWTFLVWLCALHPIWHLVASLEERLMVNRFGDDYRSYAKRTGRFVPRLGRRAAA